MSAAQRPVAGALCLFLAAAIWGGMYVVSKVVLDHIPPMTLLAMRLAIGAAVLLVGMRLSGAPRVRRSDWLGLALLGLVGYGVSLGAQFIGTQWSSAGHGAVLTSITPACILVFAALLRGERITRAQVLAVGIATAGVLLVVEQPRGFTLEARAFWGDLLLLLAGGTWALYTVLCRMAADRYPPITVTTYAMCFGIFWVLPATPLEGSVAWRSLGAGLWWGIGYLGVVSTAVAFYLWNKGFTMLDAATGSLFFFAQPIVGALLGWLWLGEPLSARFVLGTAVVIAGGILATRRRAPERVRSSAAAKPPRGTANG
jgi:drug/metabolite transporter (DMT)-like permease